VTDPDVEAFEIAYRTLVDEPVGLHAVGRLWRANAATHLAERLDTELRGGVRRLGPEDPGAAGFLKGAARDLREAATALHVAAEQFRSLGRGFQANRTFHAATAAERAAEAIDPS
jgi:hypothetical protein